MGSATKAGLLGRWRIVRHVRNRLGPDASFEGEGAFTPEAAHLLWREEGVFRLDGGAPMTASRSYRWRFTPDRIFVDYADGAPFHDFAPDDARARHLCGEDHYAVHYRFDPPDRWRVLWRVRGPRKDYEMASEMTRPCDA